MLQVIEVAMNTCDMAGSLRFYSEVFGFRNAGGQCTWGNVIRAQGLPPESRALKWWLVGKQDLVHLEFFTHTVPAQRPQRADWSPRDRGWVRFGLRVRDFDQTLAALATWGIRTFTAPVGEPGSRRLAFHEPLGAVVVEVIEAPDVEARAEIASVTASVADLEAVRAFYEDMLGFAITPLDDYRPAADEALWGLADAKRDGFVADGRSMKIEVVRYDSPAGFADPDYRSTDQGMVNIAIGSHDKADAAAALANFRAAGLNIPHVVENDEVVAAFVADAGRQIELAAFSPKYRSAFGFTEHMPFLNEALASTA